MDDGTDQSCRAMHHGGPRSPPANQESGRQTSFWNDGIRPCPGARDRSSAGPLHWPQTAAAFNSGFHRVFCAAGFTHPANHSCLHSPFDVPLRDRPGALGAGTAQWAPPTGQRSPIEEAPHSGGGANPAHLSLNTNEWDYKCDGYERRGRKQERDGIRRRVGASSMGDPAPVGVPDVSGAGPQGPRPGAGTFKRRMQA